MRGRPTRGRGEALQPGHRPRSGRGSSRSELRSREGEGLQGGPGAALETPPGACERNMSSRHCSGFSGLGFTRKLHDRLAVLCLHVAAQPESSGPSGLHGCGSQFLIIHHTHTHTPACRHTHTRVYTHTYTYIYTHMCIHTHTYTYMYTHMRAHTPCSWARRLSIKMLAFP